MSRTIGLTYDLRDEYIALGYSREETAECDKIETVDGIFNSLISLGYKVERIGNIFELTKKLSRGEKWDMVFNICEGIRGSARESQVPSLLDAYNIPYTFSNPAVLAFTLHKNIAKHILFVNKIETPKFVIIRSLNDIEKIDLNYPLFVKPDAEGTSKGIDNLSKVNNKDELRIKVNQIITEYSQNALVEEFLPGREFTVGVIGNGKSSKVFEIMEIIINKSSKHDFYTYENKERYLEFVEYKLLDKSDVLYNEISNLTIRAWNALECRDGGRIDIKLNSKNKPSFIEVNPLAGLNPESSDLPIMSKLAGIPYSSLIKEIIESAFNRIDSEK